MDSVLNYCIVSKINISDDYVGVVRDSASCLGTLLSLDIKGAFRIQPCLVRRTTNIVCNRLTTQCSSSNSA